MKTSRDQAHTPKSPKGMGDYYGTGIKNPVGKPVSNAIAPIKAAKKIGKAPKSLA